MNSQELLQKLLDQTLDIVYSFYPLVKKGYWCDMIETQELILVTNHNSTELKNGISQRQLTTIPFLMCNFALQEVGDFIKDLFPKNHIFAVEVDNSDKIISLVRRGLGYAFIPAKMVTGDIEREELISIPLLDFQTPKIKIYRIYRDEHIGLKF